MLIAHSEPCRHCGQIVEFRPSELVQHNGAPRKRCGSCGNTTELSFLLGLFSSLLGFVVAAWAFVSFLQFLESVVGGAIPFLGMLLMLGAAILVAVFTSIVFSTACYFLHARLKG